MNDQQVSWKYRRRYIIWVTAFLMAVPMFALWKGLDTEVAQTATSMSYVILGSLSSSYIFGAAWQHVKKVSGGEVTR